jgi:hypothetical protein
MRSARPFRSVLPVRLCLGSGLMLVLVTLAGCTSRPVITGTVTYKNGPLTTGQVSFIGADGKSRSSGIGSDGTYEIVDAPPGDVTIVVIATKAEGKATGASPLGASTTTPQAIAVRSLIPVKYNDPKTSGLTYLVTPGKQTKNIELGD